MSVCPVSNEGGDGECRASECAEGEHLDEENQAHAVAVRRRLRENNGPGSKNQSENDGKETRAIAFDSGQGSRRTAKG